MRPDPPAPVAAAPVSQASSVKEASQNNSPTSSTAGGAPAPAKLATRPKLNLQKRTVSQAQGESPVQASAPADPKVSPFGAARPIDTAAREKEVEEKLRQRKEQEEKQREEKRAAEDKAKEERRLAKDQERPDKSKAKANGSAKEADAAVPAPSKKYEILRREAGDDKSNAGAKETDQEEPNGLHPQDSNVASKAAGQAAQPGEPAAEPASPAAPAEDDGWSTVSKPKKNRRPGARAGA